VSVMIIIIIIIILTFSSVFGLLLAAAKSLSSVAYILLLLPYIELELCGLNVTLPLFAPPLLLLLPTSLNTGFTVLILTLSMLPYFE